MVTIFDLIEIKMILVLMMQKLNILKDKSRFKNINKIERIKQLKICKKNYNNLMKEFPLIIIILLDLLTHNQTKRKKN